ncbi:MAG: MmgE/PrpD family protein [Alphaproteobacteria bacterium]|nr:MmgE/PrpD family protein [Alphaproteobacteria bacterium]
MAAPGPAHLVGAGARLGVCAAALCNGAAMHVLDYEAMWSPPNHATSTCLPAVLALAEERGASGAEALAAFVAGVEMQGRLRVASGVFEPRAFRFHPPGVVGPLGAAVAAGHLLVLDATRLTHAIGIAASRAGSLLANAGTMTKCLHCGQAAAFGLEAALLAADGFTANLDALGHGQGFFAAFFNACEDGLLLNYGEPWRLVEPGYAIKRFPCQYGTHFVINAALQAAQRVPRPAAIRAVRIVSPVMPYVDRPAPADGLTGKFSFQYTAAAALLDRQVGIDSFRDERRFAADMVALLPLVQVEQREEIPASFEAMHVELEVTLADGHRIVARCDKPKGYIGAAPLSEAEHLTKVEDCLSRALAPARAAEAIEHCQRFDRLPSEGIGRLMTLLAGE